MKKMSASSVDAGTLETIGNDEVGQATGGFRNWSERGFGTFSQSYVVQRGDNLTQIANQSGRSLNQLLTWNPQYRENPNLIHPGDSVVTGRGIWF